MDKGIFLLYYVVDGGDQVSSRASTSDIVAYLAKVKNLLSTGKYDFISRRKNMQALAQHGLTITDAYVKMKIIQENGDDILKCLGFHEDDFA